MKINFNEVPDPGDRYEFGDILGFGVFGKVYLATDSQASKKKVAIKLQKYENGTKEYVEKEYEVLRDLSNHMNLVDFYGIYRRSNEIWFVMELCEGGPVTDLVNGLLAKNRRMAEEHIACVLKEVVKAVIYLHENNIIHRDIKGNNILLTKEGEVKLCDFGLSQKTKNQDQKLFTRMGSPCWMAPELVSASSAKENSNYDNRVDVWAIGITAIEIGEGKVPFQEMHPTRALFQILTNPPPALQKISHWSEYYHDFICECLVKQYEHRPFSMEIIEHPFLTQIPENNYHLTLEIKSLLSDIPKTDPLERYPEINVQENFIKKNVDGEMEPMYDEDLAALQSLSENSVLKLLEKRSGLGECYTFIGDILLYLNPNENKSIYNGEFHRKYYFKSRSENAPHIYAVGDTAYQNALHHVIPQQIVLSGESGSGKTANYLHLIDHLFYLGQNPNINSERIKNAVELLHAFIHASTPTNDNSTRAIFKTNVSYGTTGKLSGVNFKVLCLEKWRISSTDMSQGNFNILYYFYDGIIGTDPKEKLKLNSKKEYRYLRISENSESKNNTEENINKYRKLWGYLEELEFSEDQINTINTVLASILILGEARFKENNDHLAELENKEVIKDFADLLDVDDKKICWALTNYCLVQNGNAIRRKNTCEEARETRDVLANNLYTRLVDYVVNVINDKLSFGKAIFGEKYSIKILDYFGFECFKWNYFTQLIVNSFNEQLHYHYLQRVFSWEIMDLRNEEVKYKHIQYYNNKNALNELLGKPEGVLSIIDDASRKSHTGRYVIDNIQNQEKTRVILSGLEEFSVAHYTGKVSYSASNMPEKNRDFLPPEITETMRNSQNPVIKMFFTNKLDKTGNLLFPREETRRNRYTFTKKMLSKHQYSQIKKMRTQAMIFRSVCLEILKELSVGTGSGGTHFIKCIRTNLQKKPRGFENELVRQQIRSLAIVETAKSRQQGYPHRISFPEFIRRYKFLAFDFDENVEMTRDNCRLLMVRLKMEGWTLGKTKIFLKYYNEEYLARLYETQVKKIIKIQSILRGFLAKCRVAKEIKEQEKECVNEIKRRRSSIMTEEEAAEIIQKAYRQSVKRKELFDMYEPLKEEDCNFIKPFALKWKNKSLFQVLMRYRAVRLQDFFNFSQQVHIYNLNAFYNIQKINNSVDIKLLNEKATVAAWLGEVSNSVLKLNFRLDDIPFYDTTNMYDIFTNAGFTERDDLWDTPYRWRESQLNEDTETESKVESAENLVNIQYTRDPDEPIPELNPVDDVEECIKQIDADAKSDTGDESVEKNDSPERSKSFDSETKSDDENIEKDSSNNESIDLENEKNIKNIESKPKNIDIEKIEISKENKLHSENFIISTKPANKDFDYIKASPITTRPKHVDPIAELRNMARRDSNASDDDPPFNFKGMLRKTNFKRDSFKNKAEIVRRFSLTKDQEKTEEIMTNGTVVEEEPIVTKPVTIEILPGLFINGLEIDL